MRGVCLALLVCTASLCANDKPGARSIWSFDLRGVGYRADAPNPEYLALVHRTSPVLFVDDGKVLAYFVDVNPTHQLQTRGENNRFQLHLLLLDVESSHVIASASLPTSLAGCQVLVASNGHILVNAANALRAYSDSLQLLSEELLPSSGDTWLATVSPAGKTLLLIQPHAQDGVVDIFARRADTLEAIRSWRQHGEFRISCLDDYVYERVSDELERAALLRLDTNQWTIVNPKLRIRGSWTVSAVPGQRLLFVSSQGLYLGDISGNMQALGRIPNGFTPATASVASRNGAIAAVPLTRYQVTPFAVGVKITDFRVQVYDLGEQQLFAELNMKPIGQLPAIRAALSPRGDKLLVMNSHMLSMHAIREAARE